jgi:hypothetical protein
MSLDTRRNQKKVLVDLFGNKCSLCGYESQQCVYDFHHLRKKEFSISKKLGTYSWEKILEESKKCIMVCANCHRELHAKIKVAGDVSLGPIKETDYLKPKRLIDCECKYCHGVFQKMENSLQNTCSLSCRAAYLGKVDWKKIDLRKEIRMHGITSVARKLGISYNAVRKRMKKENICKP